MKNEDLKIIDIRWKTTPFVIPRDITKVIVKENKTLEKDIEQKPYTLYSSTTMQLIFEYKGKRYYREENIEAGWDYNYANIPWFVEPISYDKHSPYMKIPSLAHDRLLDFRYRLWYEWDLVTIFNNNLGLFRELTSKVFEYLCIDAGVPTEKAELMADCVNTAQKFIIWEWGRWLFTKYRKETYRDGN